MEALWHYRRRHRDRRSVDDGHVFDRRLSQILQAAVAGRELAQTNVLALAKWSNGSGQLGPLASLSTLVLLRPSSMRRSDPIDSGSMTAVVINSAWRAVCGVYTRGGSVAVAQHAFPFASGDR